MKKFFITAAIFGLIAALGLAGCASEPTPSDATKQALDALKAQDDETFQAYYAGDSNSMDIDQLASQMLGVDLSALTDEQKEQAQQLVNALLDFDYELGQETVDGEKATVEATITSRDLTTIFTDSMEEYIQQAFTAALSGADESELSSMFLAVFSEKVSTVTEKNHTATTTFNLTKVDGAWKLDEFSNENIDCIMGGLISGAEETIGNLNSMMGGASGLDEAA